MKAFSIVHKVAFVALLVVAVMNMTNMFLNPAKTPMEQMPFAFLGLVWWSYFLLKLWKKPRSWGFGIGIFLLLVLVFQIVLWRLAVADPTRSKSGEIYSITSFVLYEIPLVVAVIACILLGFLRPQTLPE